MNKKIIKLVGISGVALLTVAGIGIVGLPIMDEAKVRSAETQALVESNESLQIQYESLNAIKSNAGEIDKINADLTSKFPNIPKGTNIIENITAAASAVGLDASAVTSISLASPQKLSPTGEVAAADAVGTTPAEAAPAETGGTAEGALPGSAEATGSDPIAEESVIGGEAPEEQESLVTENGDTVISGTLDGPLPGSSEMPEVSGSQQLIPGTTADPSATANPLASMEITVSVDGSKDQVLEFSKNFNSMNRTVKIKSFTVNLSDPAASTVNISGTTFLYINVLSPAAEVPVAEPAPAG